jgi:hypothetical protein
MTKPSPFRYFKTSPEIIRLAVMMYVRFPLSLRNVEDLLHERGIDISHETVRFWWNRFGPIFAAEIRKRRVQQFWVYPNWQWHLDEVFVGYCQRKSSLPALPQKSILGLIQCRLPFRRPQRLGNSKHAPVTRYGVWKTTFAEGPASTTTARRFE